MGCAGPNRLSCRQNEETGGTVWNEGHGTHEVDGGGGVAGRMDSTGA